MALGATDVAAAGMNLKVTFELKREDNGEVVDYRSSEDPMEFVCGEGLVFAGLDRGVQGMKVGESRQLQLKGDDAFGDRDEARTLPVPKAQLPPGAEVGTQFKVGGGPDGEDMFARVVAIDGAQATLDLNHPMAGVPLAMSVTLLACEPAPELPPFEVETLQPGDEKTFPSKGDNVTIHYTGELADGSKAFMDTREKGGPLTFMIGVGQVIRGLEDGVPLMSLGERARMKVPAVMAYGDQGFGGVVPPGADLLLDVELLKVEPGIELR